MFHKEIYAESMESVDLLFDILRLLRKRRVSDFGLDSEHLIGFENFSLDLHSLKRNHQTQNIVCSFENSENTQVTHNFFHTLLSHKSHTTHDLNAFICTVPGTLR